MEENSEKIVVNEEECGQRLDIFLTKIYQENSRSFLKNLIDEENVLVNGKKQKSGYKIKTNDEILICFPKTETCDVLPENIPLNIIYQDSDIAIINKQKGMVVHPAVGNLNGTLVNALLYHIKDLSGINGELRPGIVHRIDKDTTGLLVIAKNDKAHRILSEEIKNKTAKRDYVALVHGSPHEKNGCVKTYIGRDPKDRKKMAVVDEDHGKEAITYYEVVQKLGNFSLMNFHLATGRTHQIRVHCKFLNIPIVGDYVYSAPKNNFGVDTQMLHAYKLTIIHPTTNKEMEFVAPLPDYFKKILDKLEQKNRG